MSKYDKCPICGKYGFVDSHKCPPKWEVSCEDVGEWESYYAVDAEEAAIEAAEGYDTDDYSLMSGGDFNVHVRKFGEI